MTSIDRIALGAIAPSQIGAVIGKALGFAFINRLRTGGLANYVYVFHEIFVRGDYDAVRPSEDTPTRIFDVGGNIGLYTLYLDKFFRRLEVHVFEPVPGICELLGRNIRSARKAGGSDNAIFVNNVGLSDKAGTATMNYFPRASALSTLNDDLRAKTEAIIQAQTQETRFPRLRGALLRVLRVSHMRPQRETVRLVRMGDYMDCHGIDRIDIVKIDVEGHELRVLEGIEPRHFAVIDAFMIEVENYEPGNRQAIVDILAANGFSVSISGMHDAWCFIVARREGAAAIH